MANITRTKYTSDTGFTFIPARGVVNAAGYYGYNTVYQSSAASGYQQASHVVLYLYEDMTTGKLSLHYICDEAEGINGDATGGNFTVTISNLPVGYELAGTDEVTELVATDATTATGTHNWGVCCTDGGAIDNIQDFSSITITRGGYSGVTHWKLASFDGSTQYIALSTTSITISRAQDVVDPVTFVTADSAPGVYANNVDVTLTANEPNLTIWASDDSAPANARIIAYDASNNPFIATVDDGRGKIVMDGGFPKFLNTYWQAGATSYPELSATNQYLYNAFNWLANPEKVGNNNVSILMYFDAVAGDNYPASAFSTVLNGVASIAGYTLVYKDQTDFGNNAVTTIPYSELDNYAAVFIFCTKNRGVGVSGLSTATAGNLKAYREAGNGIYVITDHDVYQGTANQIVSQFGASFSGNVDRANVSVNFLRTNYGTHALWNNIEGNLRAGASEGNISITTYPVYAGETFSLVDDGIHSINALALDDSGYYYTYTFSYAVDVPSPITNIAGSTSIKPNYTINYDVDQIQSLPTYGIIRVNGVIVGDFTNLVGTLVANWFGSDTFNLNKNEDLFVEIITTAPIGFVESFTVTRFLSNPNPISASSIMAGSRGGELSGEWGSLGQNIDKIALFTNVHREVKATEVLQSIVDYFKI